VSDILRAVEGSPAPTDCVDDVATCPRADSCVTRDLWVEMKQAMDGVIERTTLQDLIDRHRARNEEPGKCPT
jgi:DNA-binding IscR family transcriptional regulator